jgi:hypothetical protein
VKRREELEVEEREMDRTAPLASPVKGAGAKVSEDGRYWRTPPPYEDEEAASTLTGVVRSPPIHTTPSEVELSQ